MSISIFTTPTLYNGYTKFFETEKGFLLNGEVYGKGEFKIVTRNWNEPYSDGRYVIFYIVSNENENLFIAQPNPCYKWSVDGITFTDPTLLYEAIYMAIRPNEENIQNTDEILKEISLKLPEPKKEPNHYSGTGTIVFPADTQSSITITAISDLQVIVNGTTRTLIADSTTSFSSDFILNREISVTGNYFIAAIGDKII